MVALRYSKKLHYSYITSHYSRLLALVFSRPYKNVQTYHCSFKGVVHHGHKNGKSHDHHINNIEREVDCTKRLRSRESRITNFNIFRFKETDQQPKQTKKRFLISKDKKYGMT